jgi:uncharacterized membrane protein YedE/YeeE
MMAHVVTFMSGLLFALGLGISQMTQPQKITNFLNFMGDWDPSLLLVMAGATGIYFITHQLILRWPAPVMGVRFQLPTRREIDRPLIMGAALFGVGWGMVGFCPGPALAAIVTGNESVLIFVLSMGVGMYAFEVLDVRFSMEPDGGAGLLPRHPVGKP